MKKLAKTRPRKGHHPLFRFLHKTLTRSYFVETTKTLIEDIGLDPTQFAGHSYRTGAASTASEQGFSSYEIKMLGHWQSEIYNIYLRKLDLLASFAKRLVMCFFFFIKNILGNRR